jgi:hypothetical protein
MLVLKEELVQFEKAIDFEIKHPFPFMGIFYQNQLFRPLKNFPKDELELAENFTRELSTKSDRLFLLVEEKEKYSIWQASSRIKFYNADHANLWIDRVDLNTLVRKMRDIGGIKVKDRRYRLRIYPRCFIGSEAVEWMKQQLPMTDEECVKLGQRLIDAKLIHHVTNDHEFRDGFFFYRFYWDE